MKLFNWGAEKKRMKENEHSMKDVWEIIKYTNVHNIGILGENRKGKKNIK